MSLSVEGGRFSFQPWLPVPQYGRSPLVGVPLTPSGPGSPPPKSLSSMPSTVTKTTPLQLAEQALHSAEAHLRQAREELDDEYLERLAILEANVQAVIDGVKRVTGAEKA